MRATSHVKAPRHGLHNEPRHPTASLQAPDPRRRPQVRRPAVVWRFAASPPSTKLVTGEEVDERWRLANGLPGGNRGASIGCSSSDRQQVPPTPPATTLDPSSHHRRGHLARWAASVAWPDTWKLAGSVPPAAGRREGRTRGTNDGSHKVRRPTWSAFGARPVPEATGRAQGRQTHEPRVHHRDRGECQARPGIVAEFMAIVSWGEARTSAACGWRWRRKADGGVMRRSPSCRGALHHFVVPPACVAVGPVRQARWPLPRRRLAPASRPGRA
jgi:hypothetical protein